MKFKDFMIQERFKEFQEDFPYLAESPVAYRGDYNFKNAVHRITDTVVNLKYKRMGKINVDMLGILDVFKLKSENYYVVGEFSPRHDNTVGSYFIVYANVRLKDESNGYSSVKAIKVSEGSQGLGIGTELYKFFVQNRKIKLISDDAQFFGARKLWSKLSRMFVVDLLDFETNEIIKKNIKIKPEKLDGKFDKYLWSSGDNQDYSKYNLRFILKDII